MQGRAQAPHGNLKERGPGLVSKSPERRRMQTRNDLFDEEKSKFRIQLFLMLGPLHRPITTRVRLLDRNKGLDLRRWMLGFDPSNNSSVESSCMLEGYWLLKRSPSCTSRQRSFMNLNLGYSLLKQ